MRGVRADPVFGLLAVTAMSPASQFHSTGTKTLIFGPTDNITSFVPGYRMFCVAHADGLSKFTSVQSAAIFPSNSPAYLIDQASRFK